MNRERSGFRPLAATVVLAVILWFITFALPWGVFWFKISVSAASLAILALMLQPVGTLRFDFNLKNMSIGLVSALVLYLIFRVGKTVSTSILPFAGEQIDAVYGKGEGTPGWLIMALLFFVTGPCEEIYWRGYLQRRLMLRFGGVGGWLLATAIYGAVHISSGNFMLTAAALVAGAFWGAIYRQYRDITTVIISHSIWSTVVFAVLPI